MASLNKKNLIARAALIVMLYVTGFMSSNPVIANYDFYHPSAADIRLDASLFITLLLGAIIFRKKIARMYRAVLSVRSFSLENKLLVAAGVCTAIGLFMLGSFVFGLALFVGLLLVTFVFGGFFWFIVAAATSSSRTGYTSSSSIDSGSYRSSNIDSGSYGSSLDVNPATGQIMIGGIGGVDVSGNSFGSNSSSRIGSGNDHMGGF